MRLVATVLTVYGIETSFSTFVVGIALVATVLTVYGIETSLANIRSKIVDSLQQYLPFTVLKLSTNRYGTLTLSFGLQQYLPFTVCDEGCEAAEEQRDDEVRTSLVPD